ncbi:uncharacterized protein LOC131997234 [Stomoxys calcitrans]|uniref:uncharacterized protein LOC106092303 n=1 Tax=Stomoxys calcitrans TaxID=35570 RepID=UPI0027E2377B|nr:uncharacterized protein LOC106092303 [Stomoxys calcitrans]XP_059223848.1 uncharacterized protein LOC131997234 [Stomoxys calcitrans]
MKYLVAVILLIQAVARIPQTWSAEQYDADPDMVNVEVGSPDVIDIKLSIDRIARGYHGISGYFDIKQDIDTDQVLMHAKIYRSYNRNKYQNAVAAFEIRNQTLTSFLNKAFKQYVYDDAQNCCTNVPQYETFESPLTKRYIECTKCRFSTEKWPNHLKNELYTVAFMFHGNVNFNLNVTFLVEPPRY